MNDSTPNPKIHSIYFDFFGPCLYEKYFQKEKVGKKERKKEGRKKEKRSLALSCNKESGEGRASGDIDVDLLQV